MMFLDNRQHSLPHIHVEYQGESAVISIPEGELQEGQLPGKKLARLCLRPTSRVPALVKHR